MIYEIKPTTVFVSFACFMFSQGYIELSNGYCVIKNTLFRNTFYSKKVRQSCYGSRMHQLLIFRRHHWLGKTTVTLTEIIR